MRSVQTTEVLDCRGEEVRLLAPIEDRDYQQRIIGRGVGHFLDGDHTVMIEAPCGAGKTVMGMAICALLSRFESDLRINWMTMRRNVLRQARECNDGFFGMDNVQFVSMFDQNPPQADLLVSDEAQHDACSSASNIFERCGTKRVLGLSATPYRTDRLKLAFQRVIRDAGIHRLIRDGWLSSFWHHAIDEYTVETVAETYLADPARWGRSAAYFFTVDECRAFTALLGSHGVRAEVVHGDMNHNAVDAALEQFDGGQFPVLASAAKLTEGFDCPALQTVFARDSSKLPAVQICGRGLRLAPGKPHCNIVQSVNTKWSFTRTARPERAFVLRDGDWMELGESDAVSQVAEANRAVLVRAPVRELPAALVKKQKRPPMRMPSLMPGDRLPPVDSSPGAQVRKVEPWGPRDWAHGDGRHGGRNL